MAKYILDRYSLLHIIIGILAFQLGIKLETWLILNALLEILEISGMIDKYIYNDSDPNLLNSISDVALSGVGWRIGFSIAQNII